MFRLILLIFPIFIDIVYVSIDSFGHKCYDIVNYELNAIRVVCKCYGDENCKKKHH